MIITRTPMRISFIGGGTDIPSYYQSEHRVGTVVNATIDKYVYITVSKQFDASLWRASYSTTEVVDDFTKLRHTRFREALRLMGIEHGVEITSVADVPSGTGLGSSSSCSVGVLSALSHYTGNPLWGIQLAEAACKLEIDILKEPIGKQDQYAATVGSLRRYEFYPDHVDISPQVDYFTHNLLRGDRAERLRSHLLLFYIGGRRDASRILKSQEQRITGNLPQLDKLATLATKFYNVLIHDESEYNELGEIMHAGWEIKRELAEGITNRAVDECYTQARKAGAIGGKLLGAGGTGFLLLFCEPKKQAEVRNSLQGFREIEFQFDNSGCTVIYNDAHRQMS